MTYSLSSDQAINFGCLTQLPDSHGSSESFGSTRRAICLTDQTFLYGKWRLKWWLRSWWLTVPWVSSIVLKWLGLLFPQILMWPLNLTLTFVLDPPVLKLGPQDLGLILILDPLVSVDVYRCSSPVVSHIADACIDVTTSPSSTCSERAHKSPYSDQRKIYELAPSFSYKALDTVWTCCWWWNARYCHL